MGNVLVKTMQGLGDAFAALPTIRALNEKYDEVILETPWPQIFENLRGVKFIRPQPSNLRWQQKNIERWFDGPPGSLVQRGERAIRFDKSIELTYSFGPERPSIPEQLAECAGVNPRWDRFAMPPGTFRFGNLGIFRQPTVRTEYHNTARNPEPMLMPAVLDMLARRREVEWLHVNGCFEDTHGSELGEKEEPFYSKCAMAVAEQFSLGTLLQLIERAAVVVAPVSWLAWAGAALGVPTLCIFGGFAGPEKIFGPCKPKNLAFITPDRECQCFDPRHKCDKSTTWERAERMVSDFEIAMV